MSSCICVKFISQVYSNWPNLYTFLYIKQWDFLVSISAINWVFTFTCIKGDTLYSLQITMMPFEYFASSVTRVIVDHIHDTLPPAPVSVMAYWLNVTRESLTPSSWYQSSLLISSIRDTPKLPTKELRPTFQKHSDVKYQGLWNGTRFVVHTFFRNFSRVELLIPSILLRAKTEIKLLCDNCA